MSVKYEMGGFDKFLKEIRHDRVALLTSPSFKKRGIVDKVVDLLSSNLVSTHDLIVPNPTIDSIVELGENLREKQPNCLLAIGGGSTIDTAKGVARILSQNENWSLRNHLAGQDKILKANTIPLFAIPTTAGTGSEVTSFGTIWDPLSKKKYSVVGKDLYPEIALLDPELTTTLSVETTIASGLDAVSHALESAWNKNANKLTWSLCVKSLKLTLATLPKLLSDPLNLDLRARMMEASTLSGLAISQTRTSLAHSISYPLTMHFGLPHGFACSFTLPEILRFNSKTDDNTILDLAKALDFKNVDSFHEELLLFLDKINLKRYLQKYVSDTEEAKKLSPLMLSPTRANNNLRSVGISDVSQILEKSLSKYII